MQEKNSTLEPLHLRPEEINAGEPPNIGVGKAVRAPLAALRRWVEVLRRARAGSVKLHQLEDAHQLALAECKERELRRLHRALNVIYRVHLTLLLVVIQAVGRRS